ncbi:NAD(P)H-binding protein [Empedobacter brevis]|uniref:NAD(P)H-binding protein n=1 Tax=Empedobacter brevis TaxID=247 RepID=UPI002FE1DC95
MKVLLVGATGATGKDLLHMLFADKEIESIDIFVRREIGLKHEKLNIHIINFDKPEEWKQLVKGDVLFSCLGTTLKTAGSKEEQWKIDYEYQYQFAKAAKQNNVAQYVLVSTINASSKSWNFYGKMKGRLENDVKALDFLSLIILQPPLLIRENNSRTNEVIGGKLIKLFNKVGLFRSQKPLSTKLLAEAMLVAAKTLKKEKHTIKGQKILNVF